MISFAILTHNETDSLNHLLSTLLQSELDYDFEVVIVDDFSGSETTAIINNWAATFSNVKILQRSLNNDFAAQKNFLNNSCEGDYIFNIDADELPNEYLLTNLQQILDSNPDVDLYYVPRINIVNGITGEDISHWGWKLNDSGWINFPDYQSRIYINDASVTWERAVHERISGFKKFAALPATEEYSLMHVKDIERQRKQNEYYEHFRV